MGIVSPCAMIEKATTANVDVRIISRIGKSEGRDKASAIANAPRNPPHHKICCSLKVILRLDLKNKALSG